MPTINERFAQFIDVSGTNQAAVAKALMLSTAQVSRLCTGKSNFSDQTLTLFCQKFGVSEAWLRYGEGEMLISRSRNEEIALMVNSIMADEDDSFRKRLIHSLCALSPDEWKVLEHIADGIKKDP